MLRASEHKDNDVATIRMLKISSSRTIVKKAYDHKLRLD